jgi:hypothetical protein
VILLALGVAAVVMVSSVKFLSTVGPVVVTVVLVITLPIVPSVPMVDNVVSSVHVATVWAKFCSSWIVVQALISRPCGVVIIANAMAWVWLRIMGIALGPVPTKQATERFGLDRVPPNLAQLCVRRIMLFGPASRTAALISLVRVLILWSRVMVGTRVFVNAIMFEFASSILARFFRCCTQLFERMFIVLVVLIVL